MQFTERVREAKFVKRYKRFFADVLIDGKVVVAHVPNTGSLKTCLFENAPCIVTETDNPARKLKATLHFIQTPSGWAGVNTALPNLIVNEAVAAKLIPEWATYPVHKPEFKISKESRIDLVLAKSMEHLKNQKELHFIEIKNVTYAEDGIASFPDAETTRGQKHLKELMKLKEDGHTAEILFVVQRQNVTKFRPADEIDAEYGRLLREAKSKGVVVRALACNIDPSKGVTLTATPLTLDF